MKHFKTGEKIAPAVNVAGFERNTDDTDLNGFSRIKDKSFKSALSVSSVFLSIAFGDGL
jgi:hypothetical protein